MDHKTIVFDVNERNISSDDAGEWISFNDDYIAMFRFDSEWDNKIKTAEFIQGNDKYERVLKNDKCEVPPLKSGLVRVGVYTSKMTSTPVLIGIRRSIKDFSGVPAEPPEDVYAQLTALVESGILKGDNGLTPYVGENNNWWIGDVDTDILARGYTPVKGTDYFTESEIQQIQNEVSSGAIGDFKQTVDSETASFNTNAQEKLATYNQNDSEKTEAYNSNAQTKLADYNANADNRVAEFDARTEQIQTDISNLKITKANKTDLDKTNLYLDALYKLNKGQAYDVLQQESESYSVDVPSGSHYAAIDKVGGKSIIFNQLIDTSDIPTQTINGITFTNNGDGSIIVDGTATANADINLQRVDNTTIIGHKYLMLGGAAGGSISTYFYRYDSNGGTQAYDYGNGAIFTKSAESITYITIRVISGVTVSGLTFKPQLVDLTQMFGAGNEPSTVEEFEAMFPADYYPYCEPTIISSQNDRVDVASADGTIAQQITTGFPVLKSAGSVYDYIDINEGKLYRRVGAVDMGTFNWDNFVYGESTAFRSYDYTGKKPPGSTHKANIMCAEYETVSAAEIYDSNKDKCIAVHNGRVGLLITDSSYTDVESFKQAMQGVMIYYELAEPVIDDITIPTELTDWLDVEAGGSVTFHNADEGKRLLVPNKLSFIRKLDEVTV